MHINWVTNAQLCDIVRENLWKVPRDIDGIICIPRGGLFVGSIIAEFLHKPLYTPNSFLEGHTLGNGIALSNIQTKFNKYLVVDDSTSSGNSLRIFDNYFTIGQNNSFMLQQLELNKTCLIVMLY